MRLCTVASRAPRSLPTQPPLLPLAPVWSLDPGQLRGVKQPHWPPQERSGPCTTPRWLALERVRALRMPCTPCDWRQVRGRSWASWAVAGGGWGGVILQALSLGQTALCTLAFSPVRSSAIPLLSVTSLPSRASPLPAGFLFADGSSAVTLQDRLVEYGSTMDAVCKLACAASAAVDRGAAPVVLVHVDQAGVLHAPHAQGRSFLHECGYDAVVIPVHTHRGAVALPVAAALAVNTPAFDGTV
jgi:hypothetical protein